jgi:hypothetical protein
MGHNLNMNEPIIKIELSVEQARWLRDALSYVSKQIAPTWSSGWGSFGIDIIAQINEQVESDEPPHMVPGVPVTNPFPDGRWTEKKKAPTPNPDEWRIQL